MPESIPNGPAVGLHDHRELAECLHLVFSGSQSVFAATKSKLGPVFPYLCYTVDRYSTVARSIKAYHRSTLDDI